jgi:oligosaccharyltransferase complex subunit alpha (ribophorin I)
VGLTKHADSKVKDNKIEYGGVRKNVEPFSFEQISVMFMNQAPYMILPEASRKITVSHWGNIAIDEHIRIENIGPILKGEFSRFDYDMTNAGANCVKELKTDYPYYIKGMYLGDYIGNISSTNAFRKATNVELELRPRFPICGGW